MSSETNSTGVERLAAVPMEPRKVIQMPVATPPPTPVVAPSIETPPAPKAEVSDVLLAAFAALGYAVSARFLLFMSIVGAFALAVMSMLHPTVMSIVILGMFCLLTTLPLVWLELRAKRSEV